MSAPAALSLPRGGTLRLLLFLFALLFAPVMLPGQAPSPPPAAPEISREVIPPAPRRYFNDAAGVIPPSLARELNTRLEQYERETSNQIIVAIYPRMESPSSVEDYTVRIAEAWKVGAKGRDNGAILFVFIKDRKVYIQVGYGLEGVLTDFLCRQIIETEIAPAFRQGDYALGVRNGVNALLIAAKGEYKGSGRTEDERGRGHGRDRGGFGEFFLLLLFFYLVFLAKSRSGRGNGPGGRGGSDPPIFWGGGGFGGGLGGGGSSGGGGGFRGGGGRFGGGGAGGNW